MQSIEEHRRDASGLVQTIKDTLVGAECKKLRAAFEQRRADLEARLESWETESATIRESRRIGRNDPCPCGSGDKFKKCCGSRLPDSDDRIRE